MGLHTKSVNFPPSIWEAGQAGALFTKVKHSLNWIAGIWAWSPLPASLSLSSTPGWVPKRQTKGRLHFNEEDTRWFSLEIYVTAWNRHKLMNPIMKGPQLLHCWAEEIQEPSRLGRSRIWNRHGLFSTKLFHILRTRLFSNAHSRSDPLKAVPRLYVDTEIVVRNREPVSNPSLATAQLVTTDMSHPPQASESSFTTK